MLYIFAIEEGQLGYKNIFCYVFPSCFVLRGKVACSSMAVQKKPRNQLGFFCCY